MSFILLKQLVFGKMFNFVKAMRNSLGEEKQKTNDSEIEKIIESDNNNDTIERTNEQGRK